MVLWACESGPCPLPLLCSQLQEELPWLGQAGAIAERGQQEGADRQEVPLTPDPGRPCGQSLCEWLAEQECGQQEPWPKSRAKWVGRAGGPCCSQLPPAPCSRRKSELRDRRESQGVHCLPCGTTAGALTYPMPPELGGAACGASGRLQVGVSRRHKPISRFSLLPTKRRILSTGGRAGRLAARLCVSSAAGVEGPRLHPGRGSSLASPFHGVRCAGCGCPNMPEFSGA